MRRLEPHIGGMLAAIDCEARLFQALADDLCIVEVIGDVLTDFLLAFLGINRLCAALDDMGVAYMVGSLAGDDTAFLVMRDTESAASFCEEIKEML